MSTPDTVSVTRPSPGRRAFRDLGVALLPVVALALSVTTLLGLPGAYLPAVVALYLVAGLLILRGSPDRLPGPGMGTANRVTLGRLVLVLPLAPLAFLPQVAAGPVRWTVVALGAVALILDGVDGWVARRTGTGTAFGARFDMETDAFLILVLSVLAWRAGPVGPWILAIGALRYVFLAAGQWAPALRRELPPSMRRKVVCVVQGIALLVCLGPVVPGTLAVLVGGGALLALSASFAVDVAWALRSPGRESSEPRRPRIPRRPRAPEWGPTGVRSPRDARRPRGPRPAGVATGSGAGSALPGRRMPPRPHPG